MSRTEALLQVWGARTTSVELVHAPRTLTVPVPGVVCRCLCHQDAVVAVVTVETSMHTSAMLGVDSVLHTAFPMVSFALH